jgi:hypothetical protein
MNTQRTTMKKRGVIDNTLAMSLFFIACTAHDALEPPHQRLVKHGAQLVKGVGIFLHRPDPMTCGPQPIVVTLALGTRNEAANLSAVWLTYESPRGLTRHTTKMRPLVGYVDGFGATVPFTAPGIWSLTVDIVRVGGIPATAVFTIDCCREDPSCLSPAGLPQQSGKIDPGSDHPDMTERLRIVPEKDATRRVDLLG